MPKLVHYEPIKKEINKLTIKFTFACMNKKITVAAGIFALIAVVLGAMGAHILEKHLGPESIESFETGVRYQMYHALVLLVLGLSNKVEGKLIYGFFISGICLFSGSIYLLSTNTILNLGNISFLGPLTPLGGVLLIAGWLTLIFKVAKINNQ